VKQVDIRQRVFLIGPSGSGKSRVARLVSEGVGADRYDTDDMIQTDLDKSIAGIFEEQGEAAFRDLERAAIRQIADSSSTSVVATGGGLPIIPGMMDELNSLGTTVYLRASVGLMWRRLSMDEQGLRNRPLLRDRGQEGFAAQVASRVEVYSRAAIILDTEKLDPEAVCELLISYLLSSS
jgi:shikimate kinase